jgi:YD repeat-containing protein
VTNLIDSGFYQNYDYDFLGRLKRSASGTKVNNKDETATLYQQSLSYDAFDDMTARGTGVWGNEDGFTATYQSGRKQNSNEIYDASGNIVDKTTSSNNYDRRKFDASGRLAETTIAWHSGAPQQTSFDTTDTVTQAYDGDGRPAKQIKKTLDSYQENTTYLYSPEYSIYSFVTGKEITTTTNKGAKNATHVYMGGSVMAEQQGREVVFKHTDPVTGAEAQTAKSGEIIL